MRLESHVNDINAEDYEKQAELVKLVDELARMAGGHEGEVANTSDQPDPSIRKLPTTITFPYSRHSSYSELCELVSAFSPKQVYPCTVDETTWTPAVGMASLFGQCCSGTDFDHDHEMMSKYTDRLESQSTDQLTQTDSIRSDSLTESQVTQVRIREQAEADNLVEDEDKPEVGAPQETQYQSFQSAQSNAGSQKSSSKSEREEVQPAWDTFTTGQSCKTQVQPSKKPGKRKRASAQDHNRKPWGPRNEKTIMEWAYQSARSGDWENFGGLVSTRRPHESFALPTMEDL
jgi:hypothetical protein